MKFISKSATLVAALSMLASAGSFAQETYPSRPITLMHGSAPGGSTDLIARAIASGMAERLGQPVVVDVRAGGGGVVMLGAAAKAKPDGYTLAFPIGPLMTQAPHIFPGLPYDAAKDFTAVTKVGDQAVMIVTTPAFPARNFQEFINVAKTKPVSIAVYAPVNKIILAAISQATGAQFTEVPYKGISEGAPAMLGGHVDSTFDSPNTSLGAVKEGKYRALVVTTAKRTPMQPDVPTVGEVLKLPNFDFGIWYGIFAPTGTPSDRIDRVYREVLTALKSPKVKEIMDTAALEVSGNTPREFEALVKAEYERDGAIIKKYNIK